MAYVEWLRVGRCLKCTAWVLGVLLLLTVVAEYTFLNVGSKSALSGIELHTSSGDINAREILNGATTAYSTLPDGTKRTTIVNSAKGVRYTIDDHGYFGKHVEIFERSVKRPEKLIGFGPVGFQRVAVPGGSMVTIDTNRPQGFAYYAAIATFLGADRSDGSRRAVCAAKRRAPRDRVDESGLADNAGIGGDNRRRDGHRGRVADDGRGTLHRTHR